MKKCKKNGLKLNNAGMTLIELLVAIAIMAVALVPLLFSFVNVARYNGRSREIQQTTTLAHTVMENCKAYSMEEINSQMATGTFLSGVPATQTYNDVANSTYYMTGVTAENGTYDISLKFTPHSFVSGAAATSDILNTESINPYLDAVFTPMGTKFHVNFPDGSSAEYTAAELDQIAYLNALQTISDNMKAVTEADLGAGKGVTLSESYIENSFKDSSSPNYNKFTTSRKIRILMWNTGDHEAVNVYFDYEFKTTNGKFYYKHTKEDGTEVTYECDANSTPPPYDTIIYSNSLTNNAAHPTQIENLFFFYYPGYGGSLSVFPLESDEIVVSNQLADGTREIDVYLIKQKNPAYNDTNLGIVETSYSTKVTGMYNGSYTSGTNIYHNFDVNLGSGSSTPYNESTWFTSNLNIMPKLVPTESKILMYDVELKIFNSGAYDMDNHVLDGSAQPVLTMDGTTLDW